jgi:hypothetical protein
MPIFSRNYLPQRNWKPKLSPKFDAVGAGGNATGSNPGGNTTWTHTATGPVLAFVNSNFTIAVLGNVTHTCTYGGVTMTLLGSPLQYFISGTAYVYLLAFVTYTLGGLGTGDSWAAAANSESYKNVSRFGTPVTASGNSTSPAVTVPSKFYDMVAAGIGSVTTGSISAFNQTSRWNNPGTTTVATVIGDAPGATSDVFSATAATGQWGCVGVPLNGS